jgi:hypothetical protein
MEIGVSGHAVVAMVQTAQSRVADHRTGRRGTDSAAIFEGTLSCGELQPSSRNAISLIVSRRSAKWRGASSWRTSLRNTAKISFLLLQPAMQGPGAHVKPWRSLLKSRLAVRKFVREKATHRVDWPPQ